MTLQEMDAPALGVEERRDEAPGPEPATRGQRRTRRSWPSRRGASSARSIDCGFWGRQRAARSPARWAGCFRREGLYSSNLTEWRRARREGSLQGLTPEQTRSEARRAQPPQREGARARGESGSAGEGAAHRPIRSWTSREKLPGCWDSASNTGRTADGRPAASHRRSAWRRRAERWGCHGLPSTVVRGPLPGISSPVLRPPGPCVRPNARTSSTCSPARASSTGHRPRSSRRCSMKASICAPSARCTGSWPRTSRCESGAISAVIPATPSPSWWPRAPTRPGPGISPGSGGPNAGRPSTSMSCSTSSAAASWAGMVADRENARARRDADRGKPVSSKASSPRCSPCIRDRGAPMTSKCTAQPPRRPRGHPLSEPAPRSSDDNPFSEAQFQDPEVSPRLPWALRRHYRRHRLLPVVLPLVQHRAPPWPGSRCSPPMMSIITGHRMCWLSADVPCKPPGPFTPNASSTAPRNPPRFPKPSGSTHPPLPQQEKRVSK